MLTELMDGTGQWPELSADMLVGMMFFLTTAVTYSCLFLTEIQVTGKLSNQYSTVSFKFRYKWKRGEVHSSTHLSLLSD